jgi:hypothetical protein
MQMTRNVQWLAAFSIGVLGLAIHATGGASGQSDDTDDNGDNVPGHVGCRDIAGSFYTAARAVINDGTPASFFGNGVLTFAPDNKSGSSGGVSYITIRQAGRLHIHDPATHHVGSYECDTEGDGQPVVRLSMLSLTMPSLATDYQGRNEKQSILRIDYHLTFTSATAFGAAADPSGKPMANGQLLYTRIDANTWNSVSGGDTVGGVTTLDPVAGAGEAPAVGKNKNPLTCVSSARGLVASEQTNAGAAPSEQFPGLTPYLGSFNGSETPNTTSDAVCSYSFIPSQITGVKIPVALNPNI